MRMIPLMLTGALLSAQVANSQPGTPTIPRLPTPNTLPVPVGPEVVPASDPASLPGGTDVSQPLQPVVIPTTPTPVVVTNVPQTPAGFTEISESTPANTKPREVLGHWWDTDEVLVWWPKAHPLPPLVTASRLGAPPILGQSGTTIVVGNQAIANQDITGYRTVFGVSLNQADTVGLEARYFFLGTRTLSQSITDLGNSRYRSIGLPYINAQTGEEDVLTVAHPGYSSALVSVFTTTRVQGAEVNAVANLVAEPGIKLHAIAGYRYLQLNEGLRVEQTWLQYPTAQSNFHQTLAQVADQFSTSNRFSGGQLGVHADMNRGPFYVEMVGKLALGRTFEVVRIEGQTNMVTTGTNPLPLIRSYPGGMYAQLTNMGRVTNSAFAIVPEATFKVGLKSERGRFFVGYNFLYLSDAIRPGDQVDRAVNPTQIPLLNPGSSMLAGPDRPRATLTQTDFWVQGLVIGLEARY